VTDRKIIANEHDIVNARMGIAIQYEGMFDADTRQKLEELGMQKFIDYAVDRVASQAAQIRHYSNCLHPKIK
jgi:hypothetical protein